MKHLNLGKPREFETCVACDANDKIVEAAYLSPDKTTGENLCKKHYTEALNYYKSFKKVGK